MFARNFLLTGAASLALTSCATAQATPEPGADLTKWAESCADWDEWDKPGPPFQIHGNSYYVGTCGISSILVTGGEGHVLIDSGTEAGAEVVLANIRQLGFDPGDVKILLTSHEHHDHVGGMALLRERTGAELVTSAAAARALHTGKADPSDPQFGVNAEMAPVTVDRILPANGKVSLGDLNLTALPTPGHTLGALSWSWNSCNDAGQCKNIVYADSLSPVSGDAYKFSQHSEYLAAYRQSLEGVSALDCDLLLTPHPSASDMREHILSGSLAARDACKAYAASIGARLDKRLSEESQ